MSEPPEAAGVADREAAEWHVRLGERPVSASTLSDFRAWRASPANADAYQRLETLWRTTGSLSSDADIQALTRETLEASRKKSVTSRPRALWTAGAVVVTVVAATIALTVWLPSRGVYETAVGEQTSVRLDDGTQVHLDTATRLRVRYQKAERRLVLERGQALFVVAHDAMRPFRVAAGETEVTALGTTFDVRREDAGARVTLVTGSVAVRDTTTATPRQWRLAPGQQIRTNGRAPRPEAVDAAQTTSWSEGRLIFRNTPLRDAVAEVNRYLPDKIVLSAGTPGSVAINGVFDAGDREAFVAATSDLFDLEARPEPGGGVRLSPRSVGG